LVRAPRVRSEELIGGMGGCLFYAVSVAGRAGSEVFLASPDDEEKRGEGKYSVLLQWASGGVEKRKDSTLP